MNDDARDRGSTHHRLKGELPMQAAVLVVVVAAPFALGVSFTHYTALLVFRAVLALLALALCLWAWRVKPREPRRNWFLWASLAAAAVSVVHIIPLPPRLSALLAPLATQTRNLVLPGVTGHGPGWTSIAVDQTEALSHGLWWLTAALFYLAGAWLFHHHRQVRMLLLALGVAGLGVVAVGLFHLLAGLNAVWGVYPFLQDQQYSFFQSVLRNSNHLAGYLGLASLAFVGLYQEDRGKGRKALVWLLCSGIVLFFAVLANSRGFMVAYLLTLTLMLVLMVRRHTSLYRLALGFGLPVLLIFGAFIYGVDVLYRELNTLDIQSLRSSKLALMALSMGLVPGHALLGIGLGSYPHLVPQLLSQQAGMLRYTSPECMPLYWVVEMGVPLGLAVTVGLLAPVFRGLVQPGRTWHLAAAVMVLYVFVHNLVDFNIEMLAMQAPVFLLLGGLSRSTARRQDQGSQKTRLNLAIPALAAVLLLTVGGYCHHFRHPADLGRVRQAVALPREDDFREALTRVVERRPLEHLYYVTAANRYDDLLDPDQRAKRARMLNLALAVWPDDPRIYRRLALLALVEGDRNRTALYSRLSFMLASRLGPEDGRSFARETAGDLMEMGMDVGDLMEMLPHDRDLYAYMADYYISNARKFERATTILNRAQRIYPDAPFILLRRARIALRQGDVEGAVALLDQTLTAAGKTRDLDMAAEALTQKAQILLAQGRHDQALAACTQAVDTDSRYPDGWAVCLDVHLAMKHSALARETAQKFLAATGHRVMFHRLLARMERAEGDYDDALGDLKRGLALSRHKTEKAWLLADMALVALDMDDVSRAEEFLDKARVMQPGMGVLSEIKRKIAARRSAVEPMQEPAPEPTPPTPAQDTPPPPAEPSPAP